MNREYIENVYALQWNVRYKRPVKIEEKRERKKQATYKSTKIEIEEEWERRRKTEIGKRERVSSTGRWWKTKSEKSCIVCTINTSVWLESNM